MVCNPRIARIALGRARAPEFAPSGEIDPLLRSLLPMLSPPSALIMTLTDEKQRNKSIPKPPGIVQHGASPSRSAPPISYQRATPSANAAGGCACPKPPRTPSVWRLFSVGCWTRWSARGRVSSSARKEKEGAGEGRTDVEAEGDDHDEDAPREEEHRSEAEAPVARVGRVLEQAQDCALSFWVSAA